MPWNPSAPGEKQAWAEPGLCRASGQCTARRWLWLLHWDGVRGEEPGTHSAWAATELHAPAPGGGSRTERAKHWPSV